VIEQKYILLLIDLLGVRLGVGLKLKVVGIDNGAKSDKSIECLSIYLIKSRQVRSLVSLSVSHQGKP
jgi:hypothetical protein